MARFLNLNNSQGKKQLKCLAMNRTVTLTHLLLISAFLLINSFTISAQTTPTATNDDTTTLSNTLVTIDVLENDSEGDSRISLVGIVNDPTNGTAIPITSNGTILYTPNTGFIGEDEFTYQISDEEGDLAQATVTISITSEDPPPNTNNVSATDDEVTATAEEPTQIDVLRNDTGDNLTVGITALPENGAAVVNDDNTITYTSDAGFSGRDELTYEIEDDAGNTARATVTIEVTVPTPPASNVSATDDSAEAFESMPVQIDVLNNDTGDNLTVSITTNPNNGSASVNNDNTITYTSNAGFNGIDQLTYEIEDDAGNTASATVTIGVVIPDPALMAVDDVVTTNTLQPRVIDVLANDQNILGGSNDQLFVSGITTPPSNGSATVNNDNTITYVSNAGFSGTDELVYEIGIAQGDTDRATVTITVEGVPSSVVAVDDAITTDTQQPRVVNVLDNDTGENLVVTITTPPNNGSANVNNNNSITYISNTGFAGTDQLTYTATNSQTNESASAVLTITVNAVVADPPVANDDATQMEQNTTTTILVLNNDQGNNLSVSINTTPANGTATVAANSAINYTPSANFTGTDIFTYLLTDTESGLTTTAQVTVTVIGTTNPPTGNPPVANDDATPTLINTTVNILVLDNDTGSNVQLSINQNPANGSVNINADNTISYTPNNNYVGTDQFVYTLTDTETNLSDDATVTVTVTGTPGGGNDGPTAVDDQTITNINTAVDIQVLSNDSGNGVIIAPGGISVPANGTASLKLGGTITYTPNDNFVGVDAFSYQIVDQNGLTATAMVTVDVVQTDNQAPNIANISRCTEPLTPVTICHNWTDPDGDEVEINIDESHTTFNCSLTLLSDSCFRYTPLPGFFGTDTVFLVVCDKQLPPLCSTSNVIVHVGCVAPNANPDNVSINENLVVINGSQSNDTNGYDGIAIPVTSNDNDPCGATSLSVSTILQAPQNGTAVPNGGIIQYTPNSGFGGTEILQYVTCNNCPVCDTTTVTIQVQPQFICNLDQNTCIPPFNATELCPQFCNVDATVSTSRVSFFGTAGTITPNNANNCFSYVPPPSFGTTEVISFVACDANNACDTTRITVTIDPACGESPPIANDDTRNTELGQTLLINVLDNDNELDGQDLIISGIIRNPSCGAAVISNNGTNVTYTANATCDQENDSFDYVICDPTALCDTATVFINFDPIITPPDPPDPPNPPSDCEFESQFCTEPFRPVEICVQFCELTGDSIQVISAETTFNCSITLLNDTCIRYTPLPGFVGGDTVSILGCNAINECETVRVNVNTGCANPIAVDDAIEVPSNQTRSITVLENDTDPCGDLLNTTILGNASNGTSFVNSDGTITYTSNEGYQGADQITYIACNQCDDDGGPRCDTAVVNITVTDDGGGNPTPVVLDAEPDVVQTPYNTPISIPVTNNDSGNNLVVTTTIEPESGTIVNNGDGTITYTPEPDFSGEDYFFYQVCDGGNRCEETIVSVTVLPNNNANTPPIANNDVAITDEDEPVAIPVLVNDNDPENTNLTVTTIVEQPNNGTATPNANGTVTYTPDPNFIGEDDFSYVVCDAGNPQECDTAQVGINVGGNTFTNDPPVAQDDEAIIEPNVDVSIPILNNDSDPNADPITATISSQPAHGTATISPGGQLDYTPDPDYQGTDYLTYVICDNGNPVLCDTAYVRVTIGDGNQPPNPLDDNATTPINTPVLIDVMSNDSDPDHPNSELVLTIATQPTNGTAMLSGNMLIYEPNSGHQGSDMFTYQLCDPENDCATATVFVNIVTEIEDIDAEPDLVTTNVNMPITIPILNNDFGTDLGTPTVLNGPDNGTVVSINPETGDLTYQPNPDYTGEDFILYQICDANNNCDSTLVSITILPDITPNLPPTAGNDVAQTPMGSPINIPVTGNDSDPNGDPITVTDIVDRPENGTATPNPDGTIDYTPNPDFEGCDIFTYTICDNATPPLCDTASVQVEVGNASCLNMPPIAVDELLSVPMNTPINIPVLANSDRDPDGDPITVRIGSNPANGTLSNTDSPNGNYTYTPNPDFSGEDFFTYIICDNGQPILCDTGFVTITVMPEQDIDAEPDIEFTNMNESVTFNILTNDEGTNITITDILSNPKNGNLIGIDEVTGDVTYIPENNFTGTDYFVYQICNTDNECDTTTASITVLPPNTPNLPPTAGGDLAETLPNIPVVIPVTGNDSDPNGDPLTVTDITTPPSNGTVTPNPDGTVTYTPNPDFEGCDLFAYLVCDDGTPQLCDTAFVGVSVGDVNCLNNPPLAFDDRENTEEATPVRINVLRNGDIDPDGDNLTIIIGTEPGNGQITEIAGPVFTYLPDEDFIGVDYFNYIICDDGQPVLCDTATVSITVSPSGLDAEPDIDFTPINTPVDILVLENDIGTGLEISAILSNPDNGQIEWNSNGTVTYTPDPDFVGTDYFQYQVTDTVGDTDFTLVTIIVLPDSLANVPPNAVNDEAFTAPNTPVLISPLMNDTDPLGGDTILITDITQPENGTVVVNPDGTITYTPNPDVLSPMVDTFTYVICDNGTPILCDTAVVAVGIDLEPPLNLFPVALDDSTVTNMNTPIDIDILDNDFDPENGQLTITVLTDPRHGTTRPAEEPGVYNYSPEPGFTGIDFFTYAICDDGTPSHCDTAFVTIIVQGDTAQIGIITPEETPDTVCIGNFLPEGFVIDTIIVTSVPENGVPFFPMDNDSCIAYQPNDDFVGDDEFSIEVCDSTGNCMPVNVDIIVLEEPDPPIAVNDTSFTDVNTPIAIPVLANDSDPDDDPIVSVSILEGPFVEGATVQLDSATLVTVYMPADEYVGTDSFSYLITDSTGMISDTAWVFITIDSIPPEPPEPPEMGDIIATIDRDTTTVDQPISIRVLDNDQLPDSNVVSIDITVVDNPMDGAAIVNDSTITYAPQDGFVGVDTFTYRLCATMENDSVICDTAEVIVVIRPNPSDDCQAEFSAGFSPNEDGFNEEFLIGNLDDPCFDDIPLKLIIFNRWGDIVYLINNYSNDFAWDGTFQRNGNPVPDGTYYYLLWFEIDGEDRDQSGFVEVKR